MGRKYFVKKITFGMKLYFISAMLVLSFFFSACSGGGKTKPKEKKSSKDSVMVHERESSHKQDYEKYKNKTMPMKKGAEQIIHF